MNLLSRIIWHLATGSGQLCQLQISDYDFNLFERIIKTSLFQYIRTARHMITSAINPVLAMTEVKREQRTFQVLSKEGCSKKETIGSTFQSAPQYQLFFVWLVSCRLSQSH